MNPTGDKLTAELQNTVEIEKPVVEGKATSLNPAVLNPTGDKLTKELQKTVDIEKPVVEGIGTGELKSIHTTDVPKTTTGKTLEEGVDVVGSGMKWTGEKLGAGLDTVGSGVQYTGEKIGEGVKFTTEVIGEGVHTLGSGLKATGQFIGEKLENVVAPTIAAGGDKIEEVVQKGVEVIEEEKARTELPAVITLLQSGAARFTSLLMGTAGPNPDPFKEEEKLKEKEPEIAPQTVAPEQSVPLVVPSSGATITSKVPEIVVTQDRVPETIVHAQTTLAGDTLTTDISTTGHWTQHPQTRLDVVKEMKSSDLPKKDELGSISRELKGATRSDIVRIHEQPTSSQETQLLPNLTKKDVHDASVFLTEVAPKVEETGQSHEKSVQLPDLTKKSVQDAAVFIKHVENQTVNVDSQQKGQSKNVTDNVHSQKIAEGADLPSLTTKTVENVSTFLDTVENVH
jgi:hypothetical protein